MHTQHNFLLLGEAKIFSASFGVEDRYPTDTRYLTLFVVFLSIGFQILHTVFRYVKLRLIKQDDGVHRTTENVGIGDESIHLVGGSLRSNLEAYTDSFGGCMPLAFAIMRLAGSVILLGLSLVVLHRFDQQPPWSIWECPELALTVTFLYASVLATIAIVSTRLRHLAAGLNFVILLSALGIYVYRDIYPLTTYTQQPADTAEGALLWAKIVALFLVAVVIPLFIPRQYVPVDPKNPMAVPNSEQVASWFSRLTYSYMDSIILLASKVKHLRHDQLPPLSDEDRSQYLANCAFPHLDPFHVTEPRHIFFGLLHYFRRDYAILALSTMFTSLWSFVAPIGIKKTLQYLETSGQGATTRPWVWITFLLLGPLSRSISEHWSLYLVTRMRARLQVLLTQLVFEHSLRIRLKAEISTNPSRDSPISETEVNTTSSTSTQSTILDQFDSVSEEDNRGETAETTITSSGEPSRHASLQGQSKSVSEDVASASTLRKASSGPGNLIGRINNLVTSDMENLVEGLDFLNVVLLVPLQIILSITFLYQILGWSAFVGLFTTLALTPAAGYIGKLIQDVQVRKTNLTDARVQNISEAVGVLRMIKSFGWEHKMSTRLDQTRQDELEWLWKMKKLKLLNTIVSSIIPTFSMIVTYATYTVIMKGQLNASIIFSSMAVFSIFREQLNRVSWQVALMIEAKVSLDRINDFLHQTEILDRFKEKDPQISPSTVLEADEQDRKFGFRNASFAWSLEDQDGLLTPASRNFRLHIGGELLFKRNRINMIIGPTGSGKTSLLMALLGEMHFVDSTLGSWFNLPRGGGVAYAAQESWVQNATIRDNILFGSVYDEERYRKVVFQCALERDLELFDAGDQTEVGERGLTLSGGQKARVTLARAIYSQAEIILLDDVLAALDVHTSSWIVDQCFRGDLVKGRTVLLVTHNVALASPVADFVVSISLNGNVRSQGSDVTAAIASDPILALEVEHDQQRAEEEKDKDLPPEPSVDGKLIISEEIVEGHITWTSMKLLLSGFGGQHPILFSVVIVLGILSTQGFITLQTWFLGVWGSQYERHAPSEVHLSFYLAVFSAIALSHISLFSLTNFYFNYRSVNASRLIHSRLIDSVFGSTLRWLDQTPTARIISRCTQDIGTIDGPIAQSLMWVIDQFIGALTKLFVISLFTPIFVFPGLVVGALGIWLGNLYLKAQLSVKREMSNARSPLLAHFSAAINGLISIRAYGAEQSFKDESHIRIDYYTRTARTSYNLNRWIGFRIDLLGAAFTATLASYLVYGQTVNASNTGFSLNMAVSFCTYIFWLIRIFNELEVESNSLERIQGYLDIDHEPKSTQSGKPPASWPTSGDLRVENLSARYSQDGPNILHGLSFHITSGQRIGVVGRTGSGKSSLTLALLRCIITEGSVYYDGILTNTVNLDALRSSITIIPQTPELLSGTLRQNLDPFDQKDDATLNAALQDAGLFSLQEDADEMNITLDTKIAGSGNNFSVGQRQIIALARAMVRESKLLILDEATSAIDYKTDAVIQDTLRSKLRRDVTVITVAHRLQTIMDADKIMVLDAGNIIEFDSPKQLLRQEKGALRALVEGSGDKSALYAQAVGK